jgi:hypothetical protein
MTSPCDGDDGGITGQTWCIIEQHEQGIQQPWNPAAIGAKEDIGVYADHYWSGSCEDGSKMQLNFSYLNTEPGFDFVIVCERQQHRPAMHTSIIVTCRVWAAITVFYLCPLAEYGVTTLAPQMTAAVEIITHLAVSAAMSARGS